MKLGRCDLNLLLALDALFKERNVTNAGDRIGLSQSAMSGALARLRHMFKDHLLVRVGRNMELTPLALELQEPLKACIRDVERLLNTHLAFEPASEHRVFTIATSDYLSFLILTPLITRLEKCAPGVTLRIIQIDADRLDQLAEDAIDFVIMPSEVSANFPSKVLFEDRWVCAVWAHNPEVGVILTQKQYLELPHLVSGQQNFGVADAHINQAGIKRNIVASVQSFLLAPFIISGTRMVTLLHRRLGERVKAFADIRLIEPPIELPIIHESIFWNPRHTNDPPYVWLLAEITNIVSRL